MSLRLYILVPALLFGCHVQPVPVPPVLPVAAPRSQNPSPMLETARKHQRIIPEKVLGISFSIDSVFAKPVDVFIPQRSTGDDATSPRVLLVHLFGAAFVTSSAVASAGGNYVVATVNLAGGSSAYERPLSDSAVWNKLLRRVREETSRRTENRTRTDRVFVSAFSAGYGGVRALLSDERITAGIDGVVLLDGLHTSYVPERAVLSEGGALDTAKLVPFLNYARRAAKGDAAMLITHSEIFPGTFASTTETTDWLIAGVGASRTPVLAWGPGGMQQISEVRRGRLAILGFAGNTGPDHIDHLHGLGEFLRRAAQ